LDGAMGRKRSRTGTSTRTRCDIACLAFSSHYFRVVSCTLVCAGT
jgi:hypothetical protein